MESDTNSLTNAFLYCSTNNLEMFEKLVPSRVSIDRLVYFCSNIRIMEKLFLTSL